MIETLRISDLALVDRVEIEFGPGLNVVTGETGAGKSIVLGALGLLAGARASAEVVRQGADEAVVEAVFRTERLPELEAELRERGLEVEEHELLVSRSVQRAGRSRAQIAGRLVPASTLAELFAGRLEISSQHESQGLRRPEQHGRLLDAFGGLLERRARVEQLHGDLRATRQERERLEAQAAERARRQDFVAFQLGEIDEAALEPGELESLGAEHTRLVNAERLRGEVAGAASELVGDLSGDAVGAVDQVDRAARRLEMLADLDASLGPLAGRLRSVEAELVDVARDLERYADGVEGDPARLEAVEVRIGELERLRSKYGVSEDEILATRQRLAEELEAIGGSDERTRDLVEAEDRLRAQLAAEAEALSAGRREAARRLGRQVEAALRDLDMPKARLEVRLEPVLSAAGMPCGPSGSETSELLLAANPGEEPRPLRRIASGGELSRAFLALKSALRRADAGMVLVFDEVDAGIGGRAADRVGSALAELATEHQVLCITHLPQIAAAAGTHLRVAKGAKGRRTATEVTLLSAPERVEELARMAGGETVGDATRQHARALLRSRQAPDPPARRGDPSAPRRRR